MTKYGIACQRAQRASQQKDSWEQVTGNWKEVGKGCDYGIAIDTSRLGLVQSGWNWYFWQMRFSFVPSFWVESPSI